ncbi:MAG: collagen-binding domain-containing protein, partial [Anaerotignaceae bacterium]
MPTNFGVANAYNVFVIGNMTLSNTDAEGRVAIGGNATLTNYGVGSSITPLPPYGTDASLVIGGNINITNGSN